MLDVFRNEIKYIIPYEKALKMSGILDQILQRDSYGEEGRYIVRSQYYDSLDDQDLFDNLQGVMEKRKIRLRIYAPDTEKVKLEYKCKSNTSGRKLSMTITREEACQMERGQYDWLLKREEELAGFLYVKMVRSIYMPKTIVEYNRLAYTSPVSNVRITFDTNLRGTQTPYGLFEYHPPYLPLLNDELAVMEVKFDHFLPEPIRHIIDGINSVAEANSKYSGARMLL